VATADRTFTAPYLVAADGANSQVRHLLRLGSHIGYGMALECCVPPGQFPQQDLAFDFGVVPAGYGWVFPKGDHLNVGVYSMGKLDHAKAALDAYLERKLGLAPPDAYHGHRIPHHGHDFAPTADEARQLYFVGDAAGLVDPLLGEGIYHAVRSGQLAAAAIAAHAAGQTAPRYATLIREITADLRAYWRETQWFYANVDRGYRLLTMPLARHVLIRGYALGLPAGRLNRRFLTLPFRTPPDLSRHLAAQRG
jgi:flavin-dependent dehydrogenase